jgi:biotin transport system substrate-specific component
LQQLKRGDYTMKAITYNHKEQLIFEISLVLGFTFLMILSAYVRIPLFFTPVPVTMQTLIVYLGITFLKKRAIFSQAMYIFLGAIGLPVFSNLGSGVVYLLGPTGGYIVGFFIATFISSRLLPKVTSFLKAFIFFILTASLIYGLGLFWLIALHKFSFSAALAAGLLPFIGGEIFKIGLAAFIAIKQMAEAR